ncbi:MAG: [NiFe]-hydrogenase assembly chaperone HybE [Beijerinckiaceae bacterium]
MRADSPIKTIDAVADEIGRNLACVYDLIYEHVMRDVPICNHALAIEAVGFRAFEGRVFGIVVTPWFMNLVAVDETKDAESVPSLEGSSQRFSVPAGDVDFIASRLEGFGRLHSRALFSPMHDFADMDVARQTAVEALKALFESTTVADPQATAKPPAALDRRAFLRGRLSVEETARP